MGDNFQLTHLVASPHYYDYIHSLNFSADGLVELVDGAGQALNAMVTGKYNIVEENETVATLEFFGLIETNPYKENQKIRDIESFRVKVVKEKGIFSFVQEVVWKIKNEDEHPCLLFQERYVFETDPFTFARERQVQNLYYITESKDLVESARFYYPINTVQRLTKKEILSLGITEKELWASSQNNNSAKDAS
jgi:hypothetical protein